MHGMRQDLPHDVETRQTIRDRLYAYMKKHDIGVPLLARHIGQAIHQTIPVKTLQNFLKDERRSSDAFVAMLSRFLAKIPPVDPVADIGEAMAAFCRAHDCGDWAGVYRRVDALGELEIISRDRFCQVRGNEPCAEQSRRRRYFEGALAKGAMDETAIVLLRDTLRRKGMAGNMAIIDGKLMLFDGLTRREYQYDE